MILKFIRLKFAFKRFINVKIQRTVERLLRISDTYR